jgi:hypothetical protein
MIKKIFKILMIVMAVVGTLAVTAAIFRSLAGNGTFFGNMKAALFQFN